MTLPRSLLCCCLLQAAAAAASEAPIQDNSFLVEEAYNQEAGVAQHILTASAARGWQLSYTDEWPVGGAAHQLSATLLVDAGGYGAIALSSVALSYRYQLLANATTAVAPRVSVVVPFDGVASPGLELALPLSVSLAPALVAHWNLVVADWTPGPGAAPPTLRLGQSVIWLATHAFNPMLEALLETRWNPAVGRREESLRVGPGIRTAIDLPGLQIVLGAAAFAELLADRPAATLLVYLSLEHPFLPGSALP